MEREEQKWRGNGRDKMEGKGWKGNRKDTEREW